MHRCKNWFCFAKISDDKSYCEKCQCSQCHNKAITGKLCRRHTHYCGRRMCYQRVPLDAEACLSHRCQIRNCCGLVDSDKWSPLYCKKHSCKYGSCRYSIMYANSTTCALHRCREHTVQCYSHRDMDSLYCGIHRRTPRFEPTVLQRIFR